MSLICNFIKEHDNWEQLLIEKQIKIKRENNLAIFNYDILADFSDPIVQEARGIIIDLNTLDVICFPFRKFGNYNEGYVDKIDWNSAKIQEKIDGSIIKLYYYEDKWRWSTNGKITPDDKFLELINRVEVPSKDWLNKLDKTNTYIFELISPDNQIVIKYPKTELIHLGTRNNLTEKELNVDIGFKKPKEYLLKNEEECIEFVKTINKDKTKIEHEGFVVVDKNYNRIKIKSPDYLTLHKMVNNHSMTKEDFLELIIKTPEILDDFYSSFPEYQEKIDFYKKEYHSLIKNIDNNIQAYRYLYNGNNRKDIALKIKELDIKPFIFSALDNLLTTKEIVNLYPINKISVYIKDFKDIDKNINNYDFDIQNIIK